MSPDILGEIQRKLPSLSRGQKRIAQYILDTYDKAAFMTALALGKTVQVSESTVVRFASELGYNGYPEMQKALQEIVLTRLTNVQRMEVGERHSSERNLLTQTLCEDAERLRQSRDLISTEAFDGAVQEMLRAKRIYVLGVRSSSALAIFLDYYLHYIFDDVQLITSASATIALEQLVRLTSRDVLIAISYPRYSTAVVQAMGYAKKLGAKTIALTDCDTSPLADYADYLLTTKSDMISLVNSLVAPLSVINALIVSAATHRKKETTETLDKLEDIWDAYHVYENYEY